MRTEIMTAGSIVSTYMQRDRCYQSILVQYTFVAKDVAKKASIHGPNVYTSRASETLLNAMTIP